MPSQAVAEVRLHLVFRMLQQLPRKMRAWGKKCEVAQGIVTMAGSAVNHLAA